MDKIDLEIYKINKFFEVFEGLMKERLRQENDTENIRNYFVDPPNDIMSNYNIYKIIGENDEVLYVGLTTNHWDRIRSSHMSGNGHLPDECYEEMKAIHIAPVNNRDEMKIYERYLINLLNPKYNCKMNNQSNFRFKLPKLRWYDYKQYMNIFK